MIRSTQYRGRAWLAVFALWLWATPLPAAAAGTPDPAEYSIPARALDAGPLTDQSGRTVRLGDLAGRVVLLSFGYTHCPDVCPLTFSLLARVHDRLPDASQRLAVVFVTLDPERDTPAVLGRYVGHFNPRFLGLTGTRAQVDAFAAAFGARYRIRRKGEGDRYSVDHTAFTYLLDHRGRLRYVFPFGVEAGVVRAAAAALLREQG